MDYKQCPSCSANLDVEENYIMTNESKIFNGNNVYMLCKNCGYVMVYNRSRDLIFSIDEWMEDKNVLNEIETLLKETNSGYTIKKDMDLVNETNMEPQMTEETCDGECASCAGCNACNKDFEEPQEQKFDPAMIKDSLLIITSEGMAQIAKVDELQYVPNLQSCTVYALEEVMLEPVVSFKIHKKQ